MSSSVRVEATRLEQRKTEIADLDQQAVQGRLVDDWPGDGGLADLVTRDP